MIGFLFQPVLNLVVFNTPNTLYMHGASDPYTKSVVFIIIIIYIITIKVLI